MYVYLNLLWLFMWHRDIQLKDKTVSRKCMHQTDESLSKFWRNVYFVSHSFSTSGTCFDITLIYIILCYSYSLPNPDEALLLQISPAFWYALTIDFNHKKRFFTYFVKLHLVWNSSPENNKKISLLDHWTKGFYMTNEN